MAAIANLMIAPLTNSAECIGKFLTNCGITEGSCTAAYNDVIVGDREFFPVIAEKFPDASLQSIPSNGIADFPADSDAKPRTRAARLADQNNKIW